MHCRRATSLSDSLSVSLSLSLSVSVSISVSVSLSPVGGISFILGLFLYILGFYNRNGFIRGNKLIWGVEPEKPVKYFNVCLTFSHSLSIGRCHYLSPSLSVCLSACLFLSVCLCLSLSVS